MSESSGVIGTGLGPIATGLIGLALVHVAALYLVTHLNVRYFRKRLARRITERDYAPPALVVLPCKGVEANFATTVRRLLQLDYPDYEVVFVVESAIDPAFSKLQSLVAGGGGPRWRIVVAGLARDTGQKVHNLLAATAHLPARVQVLAFLDSDAVPQPDWLRRLVAPLGQPRCGAVTGYRWFLSRRGDWPGTVLAALNSSIAFLCGQYQRLFNCVWGGAWAIRRETFQALLESQAWSGAVTEDLPVGRCLRQRGENVAYEPCCLVGSPIRGSWRGLAEFARRQYLIVRVYDRRVWWLALSGTATIALSYCAGLAACIWSRGWIGPAFLALYWGVHALRALRRGRAASLRFSQHRGTIRRTALFDAIAHPLLACLHLGLIMSSAVGRTMTWRGIRYRLINSNRTVILSRASTEAASVMKQAA